MCEYDRRRQNLVRHASMILPIQTETFQIVGSCPSLLPSYCCALHATKLASTKLASIY
jgi:hypothetical protein